jgi:hypothetical protein
MSIAVLLLVVFYFGISYPLLNGRLTYLTSSNRFTMTESKADNYFATDNLIVKPEGDSLKDWKNKFDVWTNYCRETKYYGVLFHWSSIDSSWRFLNLEPQTDHVRYKWFRRKVMVNERVIDYRKSFTGGWESCCTPIKCKVNDTVRIDFTHAIMYDSTLGALTVIVR